MNEVVLLLIFQKDPHQTFKTQSFNYTFLLHNQGSELNANLYSVNVSLKFTCSVYCFLFFYNLNTILMIPCENNYYASPEFLKLTFHVITCFALPIHAFGFYCVLCKTPSHMSSVRIYLLNLHCWCVALDLVISFFGIPYLIYPAIAGYDLGFIESPGLFFYLGVTFIAGWFLFRNWNKIMFIPGTSTSMFVLFENRYFTIFGQTSYWKYFRNYVVVASYIFVTLYFLPPQLFIPEQTKAREVALAVCFRILLTNFVQFVSVSSLYSGVPQ